MLTPSSVLLRHQPDKTPDLGACRRAARCRPSAPEGRNERRCQAITVPGLTRITESFQPLQRRRSTDRPSGQDTGS